MKNIVILLSGRGSNFVSIVKEAERAGWAKEGLKIACVVSNRPGVAGLERAKEFGIDAFCVDHKTYETREAFEKAVVVLAGFMRVLTPNFVNHFGGRILNIHPALLPLFKGLDTHQRALDAGVRLHGCTVHFVSAELDGGSIIGQAAVPVLASDTAETLAARVLRLEHILYPRAVYAVASGRVRIENGRTVTDDETAKYLAIFDKDNASAA